MDPHSQQPNYSIDYLNQIAPTPQKRGLFGDKKPLVIGLGAALIVAILIIIIGKSVSQQPNSLQQLAARLQSTQTIVNGAQPNIQSSQLRTINSSLNLTLTNTNRDIVDPLKVSGITATKLDKKVVAAESGADLEAKLEDARLNAVYDRTYAREMAYRVDTIILLMKDIYGKTHSAELKNFLQTSYQNLEPIQQQLADFNAANG